MFVCSVAESLVVLLFEIYLIWRAFRYAIWVKKWNLSEIRAVGLPGWPWQTGTECVLQFLFYVFHLTAILGSLSVLGYKPC